MHQDTRLVEPHSYMVVGTGKQARAYRLERQRKRAHKGHLFVVQRRSLSPHPRGQRTGREPRFDQGRRQFRQLRCIRAGELAYLDRAIRNLHCRSCMQLECKRAAYMACRCFIHRFAHARAIDLEHDGSTDGNDAVGVPVL